MSRNISIHKAAESELNDAADSLPFLIYRKIYVWFIEAPRIPG